MKNLTTRKIVLGLLVGLVLGFSVQGIADALTLTETSSLSQSGRMGTPFEVSFRVGLNPPKDINDYNSNSRHTKANATAIGYATGSRIRSNVAVSRTVDAGYTAGDTHYYTTSAVDTTTVTGLAITTNTRNWGVSGTDTLPEGRTWSAGNTVDRQYAGAERIRSNVAVSRTVDAGYTAGDTHYYTTSAVDTTTVTGLAITTDTQNWVTESTAYYYNDEAINITTVRDSTGSGTLKLKSSSYFFPVTQADLITSVPADTPRSASLQEMVDIGIPSSITLVYEDASVGIHRITISDATAQADFPPDVQRSVNRPRRVLTFTVHVTPATTPATGTDNILPDIRRIPVDEDVVPVSTYLSFESAPGTANTDLNRRIRYEVVRGSGTLYVGTLIKAETKPSSLIPGVHQGSNVYLNTNNSSNEVHVWFAGEDRTAPRATIIFEYKGQPVPTARTTNQQQNQNQNQQNQQQTTPNRLGISLSGSGDTRTVQVSALAAGTTSTSGIFTTLTTNGGTLSIPSGATPLTSTWTLPSAAGTYTVTATTTAGYTSASDSVTVTVPGTLTARQDGGTVVVSASPAPTSNLAFRLTTSGGVYAGGGEILPTGTGRAIPIGLTTGSHILTVNAEGYNATQVSFTPGTQTTTDTTTTTTTTTTQTGAAGVADSIEIDGARKLEGTVNQATRLRVRVLDATNRGVSGIRVTFRVLAPGRGRLSQRGNGRAVVAETDRSGYASASVTPLGGNLIVEAKAAGVSASVSFIIDVDGGTTPRETSDTTDGRTYQVGDKVPISLEDTLTFRGSRTLNGTSYTCVGSGECVVSYGTLVKGEIAATAVEKVEAKTYQTGDKMPISLAATLTFSGKHTLGGTVYTCVSDGECVVSYGILTKGEIEVSTVSTPSAGDSPGMSDAKAVVGAANRPVMYWIAGGGLYRLAGASAEQIAESATDVAVGSDKLYWIEQTSETRGAIHHANLDGSDAAVIKTLTSVPKGVALANGKLYITNGWGKIQRMNVDGTQFETNFLTNLGAPLGIAVSGSRIYWTDGSGRVRSAPLQGTKAIQNIVTGSGTLGGIVVDGSKVYWTEQTGARSGRIRAANLDGTGITNAYTVTATVHGLALDAANQQLYWTNGWGKVQRGVRGSRYQDVVTGLMTPTALAIGGVNTATPMPSTKPSQPASEPNYDVDGSGTVDNADLFLVSLAVGTDNVQYDVNGDGTVNDKDIALVRDNRDNGAAAAPMVFGVKLTAEQVGRLQEQIDLLIVSGDRSPDALKTLVYLQQLIATARPERTQLLANYPNPFNPETWIPYELATDTDVRITIYAANGVVVRTLQLGQQSAGYYTDRERAAYWDGRNASGEQVASGVYFYQLETDEISSLRKMVILK
ncbi:MAG: T9SS type A sorting domain-containing protein [Candidatus Poribacteria bacterium]|nr:T9SS type A sorting domain-containing protein [Candidatus Poribacteria bacterium]